VDSPASDGNGSRHNYTVIGQVGHTYDNNRNLLADGTRQFRYNYKNQLRKVWRKSDGDSTTEGRIAEYREDVFGRQVLAQFHWELSRQTLLDTRFELDVDVDSDGDGAPMTLVDGGMHGTLNPTDAGNLQEAAWPSLIDRPSHDFEAHYFDFLVDVPDAGQHTFLVLSKRVRQHRARTRSKSTKSSGLRKTVARRLPRLITWKHRSPRLCRTGRSMVNGYEIATNTPHHSSLTPLLFL